MFNAPLPASATSFVKWPFVGGDESPSETEKQVKVKMDNFKL